MTFITSVRYASGSSPRNLHEATSEKRFAGFLRRRHNWRKTHFIPLNTQPLFPVTKLVKYMTARFAKLSSEIGRFLRVL
jgi:hypothetical protein